jgi:hypothetical protein
VNPHWHNLIAFLAVLVVIGGLALFGKSTDLAIMTGLVGVLGSFRPWGMGQAASGKPDDPVNVTPVEQAE